MASVTVYEVFPWYCRSITTVYPPWPSPALTMFARKDHSPVPGSPYADVWCIFCRTPYWLSLAENGWQALRSFNEGREKKPCWSGPGHGLGGPRRAHVHKIQVITWLEYVSRCRGRVYESLRNCKLTTKVLQKLFNIHKTSCRNVRGEPLCMSWQSSRFGLTNAGVGPPAEFSPIQWRVENYFYSFSTPQTPLVPSSTAGEASLNQIVESTQKPVRTPVGILSGSVNAAEREWSRKFSQDSWLDGRKKSHVLACILGIKHIFLDPFFLLILESWNFDYKVGCQICIWTCVDKFELAEIRKNSSLVSIIEDLAT